MAEIAGSSPALASDDVAQVEHSEDSERNKFGQDTAQATNFKLAVDSAGLRSDNSMENTGLNGEETTDLTDVFEMVRCITKFFLF